MKVYARRHVVFTVGNGEGDKSYKETERKQPKTPASKEQSAATSGTFLASKTDHEEALRLKILAEEKYTSNNLKSALKYAELANNLDPSLEGVQEMLTAFKILRMADKANFSSTSECSSSSPQDYYRIFQLEDFSHINTIKKQYKKLALTLHPDKNPFAACEEAFKLVGEANRVLSDKIRKKEYDMRLRIAMQSQAAAVEVCAEMFWTACSTCKLLHQFERKYLEHSLMCPTCKKCFNAVEAEENPKDGENVRLAEFSKGIEVVPTRVSARIQERAVSGKTLGVLDKFNLGVKQKISNVGEALDMPGLKLARNEDGNGVAMKVLESKRVEDVGNSGVSARGPIERLASKRPGKANIDESGSTRSEDEVVAPKSRLRKVRMEVKNGVEDVTINVGFAIDESERAKRAKVREEETMTLAQMQMLAKQKNVGRDKLNVEKDKGNNEKSQHKDKEGEREKVESTANNNKKVRPKESEGEKQEGAKGSKTEKENKKRRQSVREKRDTHRLSSNGFSQVVNGRASENNVDTEIDMLRASRNVDLVIMPVEDSEFHDFDYDRREKSFKKGQVWAAYDDNDAMPRHYALIDDVSMNPFEVTLSWLEFQCNGDQELMRRKKMGFPLSCGKFKISRKISVKYLNLFSHLVNNERIAREMYMIYPRKGTVWALYRLNDLNTGRRGQVVPDKRSYDIIVSLSSFSYSHGLSIAFLEKVDGFRAVYNRREVGVKAVQLLGKDDLKLFSHQIPAKKLSGEEAPSLPKDCWELDPASISLQLYI